MTHLWQAETQQHNKPSLWYRIAIEEYNWWTTSSLCISCEYCAHLFIDTNTRIRSYRCSTNHNSLRQIGWKIVLNATKGKINIWTTAVQKFILKYWLIFQMGEKQRLKKLKDRGKLYRRRGKRWMFTWISWTPGSDVHKPWAFQGKSRVTETTVSGFGNCETFCSLRNYKLVDSKINKFSLSSAINKVTCNSESC